MMHTLNLLPLQQHPAQFFILQLRRKLQWGVSIIVTMSVLIYVLNAWALHAQQQKKAVLSATQSAGHADFQQAQILAEKIKAYTAHQNRITLQHAENAELLNFLSTLPQLMDDPIYLVELLWTQGKGQLAGYAPDQRSVIQFLQVLKSNDLLKQWQWTNNDLQAKQEKSNARYFVIHFSTEKNKNEFH